MALTKGTTEINRAAREAYAIRRRTLAEIGFKSYQGYLKSELWKRIRAAKLSKDPSCEFCGAAATTVHHSTYCRKTLLGEWSYGLRSACAGCHMYGEFKSMGAGQKKTGPKDATARMERVGGIKRYGARPRRDGARVHHLCAHERRLSKLPPEVREPALRRQVELLTRLASGRSLESFALTVAGMGESWLVSPKRIWRETNGQASVVSIEARLRVYTGR